MNISNVAISVPPFFYRCEPSWHWHARLMTDYDLWYVLEGRGNVILDGQNIEVTAGSCFVFEPGMAPHATQDPSRRLIVFAAHFTSPDALSYPRPVIIRDQTLFETFARRCYACHCREDALGKQQSTLLLQQMLLQLWEDVTLPPPERTDTEVQEIMRLIREEPALVWTVDMMAQQLCLSRSQFTRRFTAMTGMSPNQFVIHARIDRACQLIVETNMTVTQIAELLGYTDVYFFSRQFKRYKSISPGQYRQRTE